ncbi:NepR family anti-sigma factor [Bauldia litoralis]|uniref:NepR family anti-sigma factor n=1 Tax=Bauldia litoralis TaxID=665467 RepID=UPI003263BD40
MKDRKASARDEKLKQETNPDKTAKLGRDIQARIGEQLRAMYGDVVDQGVPDRFVDLLNQMDKPRKGDKGGNSE